MSQGRLIAYITFNVDVVKKGDLEDMLDDLKKMKETVPGVTDVTASLTTTTEAGGVSMRRFAMDMRMMTMGLYILRRELGGTSGVMDTATQSLFIFSAGLNVGVGLFRVLQDVTKTVKDYTKDGATGFEALGLAIKNSSWAGAGFILVVGAIAAAAAGTWAFEMASGISTIRDQINGWTKDLEGVKVAMSEVNAAQAGLNETGAIYQYQLAQLENAAKLAGGATKEQQTRIDALKLAIDQNKLSLQGYGVEAAHAAATQAGLTYQIAKGTYQIGQTYEMGKRILVGGFQGAGGMPPGAENVPAPQIGAEVTAPGYIYAHRGEIIEPREEMGPGFAAGAGLGGNISVGISFPGAQFNTSEDIVSALSRGGEAAGYELNRHLELMRHGVRTRG